MKKFDEENMGCVVGKVYGKEKRRVEKMVRDKEVD